MLRVNIGIALFLTFFVNVAKCESAKLLAVVTIYRHGSRAPIKIYKNDPYHKIANEIWPNGLSELTTIGQNQHFELGKWYRTRYEGFIPEKYDNKFIRVMSSDVDRCLMSAASNLAGMFPPKDDQIWNKDMPWQPVPIHTTPIDQDPLLFIGKPCPKYDKLIEELRNEEHFKQLMKHNQPTIKFIEKHSGEKLDDIFELVLIHDTLFVESFFGLELPKWSEKVYPNYTMPLVAYMFKEPAYTPQLTRIKAGPLINYITTFFENVVETPNDSQKFLMLSGHDNTLTTILTALGLYDDSWPEYASSLNIELRSRKNQPYINMYFKNSTDIYKLTLSKCIFDCNFDRFKKLTQHLRITPDDWDKECLHV